LSHYGGINDWYFKAFQIVNKRFFPRRILYPGSWIHITPSLVFPYVVYVDNSSKIGKFFINSEVTGYIKKHSQYKNKSRRAFYKSDYSKNFGEEKNSFDLLISLNSGFVSQDCSIFLKKHGLLLANNEHYDASLAYVDLKFKPIGVFKNSNSLVLSEKEIMSYFLTTKEIPINYEMVKENSKKSPSKAKYKFKKKAPLYLFQKN
jgi:hypothetical protein